MRSGGGKQKGSSFERETCRELSLWISNGERQDIFWRAAMSGGRATVGLKTGQILKAQAGDISPITALGENLIDHFVIECKSYKDLQLTQTITKESGLLHTFWNDLCRTAEKFDKHPFLIARQNQMPVFCLLDEDSLLAFSLTVDNLVAILPQLQCCVILFDCFLREAKVPTAGVYIESKGKRRRVKLS